MNYTAAEQRDIESVIPARPESFLYLYSKRRIPDPPEAEE
jgi:hypothetical protein